MPVCKSCEVELCFDDTVDECVDESVVELTEIGHCPKCYKKYKWRDVYEYIRHTEPEEE